MSRSRRPAARLKSWAGRLLLLTASTALTFAALEAAVRWVAPQQPILLRPDIWVPHDGLGWQVAPGVDTRVNTGEREVRLLTDADGHRVGVRTPDAPVYRVLALGDSFLAALQVEHEDTLTALLEESVSDALFAPVRVVNTGVGGWGPSQYLIKAREELARGGWDLVLVFLFRANDVLEKRYEHVPPKTASAEARLRWPRALSRAEITDAWLYPVNNFLETRSHLFLFARRHAWYLLMRLGLSARGFPVAELKTEAASPRWQVTGEICADLAAEAAAHGVETLFVLLPGTYHVDPGIGAGYARAVGLDPKDVDYDQSSRLMAAELTRHGLRFADMTPELRRRRAAGEQTHGEVDTHLAPAGHVAIARELTAPVVDLLRARPHL